MLRPVGLFLAVASLIGGTIFGGVLFVAAAALIDQLGGDIDGEAASDYSGYSVSLSADGTIVAIGAYGNDGNGSSAGYVRVYAWNGSGWVQRGGDIDGEAESDFSGRSVSLSSDGRFVAIGANGNDGNGSDAGHVRVYEYDGVSEDDDGIDGWTQKGGDIDGERPGDESGISVSLSDDGTIVAIGAHKNDGNSGFIDKAGHVRVYEYDGVSGDADGINGWTQLGSHIDGEAANNFSGLSVSLSSDGSTVAIGATRNRSGAGIDDAGHVRVYEYDGVSGDADGINGWTQKGGDIDGEAEDDYSGRSVSLSSNGSTVAIGANGNDGNGSDAGHVRVYEYDGVSGDADRINGWTQKGGDIDGELAGDESGWSVSLSDDGTIVAIGAHKNDGSFSNAGHVRVYEYDGVSGDADRINGWTQKGGDIDGEAAYDNSGISVSLSDDGTIVAIGAADYVGGGGSSAGYVRIYSITPALDITYDSNGGSTVSDGDRTTVSGGTITTLPTNPTRSGYNFDGWWTAPVGGTQITTSSAHGQTSNFTLYAQWVGYYAFSFDPNGGPNTPAGGSQISGTSPIGSNTCVRPGLRTGYTLIGWRSDYSGTSTVYGTPCSDPSYYRLTGTTMPKADVVFTAEWQANTLTITYAGNGGSAVSDGDTTTVSGGTISTLATTTRTGYTFAGWYTAASGGTQITTSSAHGQTSNFTLYAHWTANTLNITYNSNGAGAVTGGAATTRVGGLVNPLPTPPDRLADGFMFMGWNTADDGSGVDLGTTIPIGSDGPAHNQTSDFTLYAQWSGFPLTITYDSQSGSSVSDGDTATTVGGTISTLATTTRTGYTFAGWYTATSGGTHITTSSAHGQTSNFTLYAQWTANTTAPVSSGSASPRVPAPVPQWPEAIPNVDGTVTVSWAEPFQDGAGPITGYRAVARPQSTPLAQASDTPVSMASGGSCSTTGFVCVIDGLDENVDYLFEVFASNSFGESPGRMTQWTIRIVSRVPAATEPESAPNPAPTASEPPQLPVTGRTSDLANWALLLIACGALMALRLRRPHEQHP